MSHNILQIKKYLYVFISISQSMYHQNTGLFFLCAILDFIFRGDSFIIRASLLHPNVPRIGGASLSCAMRYDRIMTPAHAAMRVLNARAALRRIQIKKLFHILKKDIPLRGG